MPGAQGLPPESVLRGLFGNIVASAEAGATTQQVWESLRAASSAWAESVLSIQLGRQPTPDEIGATASELLSGISASDVSRWRGIAGQQVAAHQAIRDLESGQQITGQSIFRAPWATTANSSVVQERYRIRVNWTVQVQGFTTIERQEWATYDLEGPLTSIEDALQQAQRAFNSAEYNRRASVQTINDYTVEAV